MESMVGVELSAEARPSGSGATTWRRPVRTLLGHVADLLLPPVCISCRARIGSHGHSCFAKIDFIAPPIWAARRAAAIRCRRALALGGCHRQASSLRPGARCGALFGDHARAYRDRHEGLPLFGLWLKKARAELLADAQLIVPVPLYRSRLWWRGFNQSAMLAQSVGRLAAFPSTASC